jgi:hypothetical protein
LTPQRRVDCQAGNQVSGYAGIAAGDGSRDAVVGASGRASRSPAGKLQPAVLGFAGLCGV